MGSKSPSYRFTNGKPCEVVPGGALHGVVARLLGEGYKYAATERYRRATFTLWDAGEGDIEVHVHRADGERADERVTDQAERTRYRKRVAAKVARLEEQELDEGLTGAQQEWLEEHQEWLEKNPELGTQHAGEGAAP